MDREPRAFRQADKRGGTVERIKMASDETLEFNVDGKIIRIGYGYVFGR